MWWMKFIHLFQITTSTINNKRESNRLFYQSNKLTHLTHVLLYLLRQ